MRNAYNLQANNAQNMMQSCSNCHANMMYNFTQAPIELSQIATPNDYMVGTGIRQLGQIGFSYSHLNTKDIYLKVRSWKNIHIIQHFFVDCMTCLMNKLINWQQTKNFLSHGWNNNEQFINFLS